jgi:hypothetical protein
MVASRASVRRTDGALNVTKSTFTGNEAGGGNGASGGSHRQGLEGGVYIGPLGTFAFDASTVIAKNHASMSNDNAYT